MKSFIRNFLVLILLAGFLFALPVSVQAQPIDAGGSGFKVDDPLGGKSGGLFTELFGCTPTATGGNVLCILRTILTLLLTLSMIIAVIFLVVGGYRYVIARGNDDAVEAAKKTITHAIVGMVVIAAAWIILAIILELAESGRP